MAIHRLAALVFALAVSALAALFLPTAAGSAAPRPAKEAASNPLEERALRDLDEFTGWLRRNDARGFIGEVGWPGDPTRGGDVRWNHLARAWYAQAEASRLWVTAWSTGDMWDGYSLSLYDALGTSIDTALPQASVLEEQRGVRRGVNVAGAEFGYTPSHERTSHFSNQNRGEYGTTYAYPNAESLAYLARRGVALIRLPFRWERIQPKLHAPLHEPELARLAGTIERAGALGMRVILDVHNYGAYYLGDGEVGVRHPIGSNAVPVSAFSDLWRRLARHFRRTRAIAGYGLMNEPVDMRSARAWERASSSAVRAIRSAGDRHRVFVAGYEWGGIRSFAAHHPSAWIRDRNAWYEAHQYFDHDRSGRYVLSYETELARARSSGSPARRR